MVRRPRGKWFNKQDFDNTVAKRFIGVLILLRMVLISHTELNHELSGHFCFELSSLPCSVLTSSLGCPGLHLRVKRKILMEST